VFVAPGDLMGIVGGRKNDDGNPFGALIVPDGLEHLVAVEDRKIEVEQDQERLAKTAFVLEQEIKGLLPVVELDDRIGNVRPAQVLLDQERMPGIVFDQ